MARNTTTTATSSSTAPKRKFGVSTANIPDSAPTISEGLYIGALKNIKADAADRQFANYRGVEDLQLFDVIERTVASKTAKNEKGKALQIGTGEYYVTGAITYHAELANSEEQPLPMDTMTIFGGRIGIHFAKDEDGNWDLDNSSTDFGVVNRTWKAFMKATGLTDDDVKEIFEATPFDEDAEIAIPERLQEVPDALELLQVALFYKTFFSLVAARVAGAEVKVNVSRRARGDSDDLVNEINTGNFNSSCGLLPLEA